MRDRFNRSFEIAIDKEIFLAVDLVRIPMKWGTDSGGSGAASE